MRIGLPEQSQVAAVSITILYAATTRAAANWRVNCERGSECELAELLSVTVAQPGAIVRRIPRIRDIGPPHRSWSNRDFVQRAAGVQGRAVTHRALRPNGRWRLEIFAHSWPIEMGKRLVAASPLVGLSHVWALHVQALVPYKRLSQDCGGI